MEALRDVYESLKGTRVNTFDGRLTIDGFGPNDYEQLFDYLITEIVVHLIPAGTDYYEWLGRKAQAYSWYRTKRRFYGERSDPIRTTPPDELDTRQQLSILKFAIYRFVYSEKLFGVHSV